MRGVSCYNLIGSAGLHPSEWSLHDVAREANVEAKGADESRNGIGSRWGVVIRGRRVRRSR